MQLFSFDCLPLPATHPLSTHQNTIVGNFLPIVGKLKNSAYNFAYTILPEYQHTTHNKKTFAYTLPTILPTLKTLIINRVTKAIYIK